MIRFSATLTRRAESLRVLAAAFDFAGAAATDCRGDAGATFASRRWFGLSPNAGIVVDLTSSSQTSMCVLPMARNYESVVSKHQAFIDIATRALLRSRIER